MFFWMECHAQDKVESFTGCCDASAGVLMDERFFVVANDEDNVLRVYDRERVGEAVYRLDVGRFLDLDPDHPEMDIEAAARMGDVIYWITSHGRNKNGKKRESRQRFFATRITREGGHFGLVLQGAYSDGILDGLFEVKGLQDWGIRKASKRAPKEEGALNIEGLAARPDGGIWIGFRNPIPEGKAILVGLSNPEQVVQGDDPKFDLVRMLDLGGNGVRDMIQVSGGWLLLAGPYDGGEFRSPFLYFMDTGRIRALDVSMPESDFNPEVIMQSPLNAGRFVLLSDDGGLKIEGEDCKDLKEVGQQRFRYWAFSLNPDSID